MTQVHTNGRSTATQTGQNAGTVPEGTSVELAKMLKMEHVIQGAKPSALAKLDPLHAALVRADAIESLRAQLTDEVMGRFYPLMNTSLGFRTDRPNKRNDTPYSVHEVRDCFIEALLLGLRLTDNEWNIISGRCYVTREGFSRLLRDFDGLTDLRVDYGVPTGDRTKGVVVPCKASWLIGNVEDRIDANIPVKGDDYATLDQLLGKADRKFKARIYNRLTGSAFTAEGEIDDIAPQAAAETAHPASTTQDAIDNLAAPKPKTQPVPSAPPSGEAEHRGPQVDEADAGRGRQTPGHREEPPFDQNEKPEPVVSKPAGNPAPPKKSEDVKPWQTWKNKKT